MEYIPNGGQTFMPFQENTKVFGIEESSQRANAIKIFISTHSLSSFYFRELKRKTQPASFNAVLIIAGRATMRRSKIGEVAPQQASQSRA